MFKRISCLVLSLVVFLGLLAQPVIALGDFDSEQRTSTMEKLNHLQQRATPAENSAETTESTESTVQDEQTDTSEGPSILLDGAVIEDTNALFHEQTTYVSLRAVAAALRPDATIAWKDDYVAVTAENLSITARPGDVYIQANGRCLYVPNEVLFINNCTMLPIRVLAQALGAEIWWDPNTGKTHLTSGTGAIVSGDEFYDEDDLYWLSHIINAESGNQPLSGKIGVGNVILNRAENPIFPDTIYGVIFQANQFTPAKSGSINMEPNEESVIAAKLCLEGTVILPTALWFNRAGVGCWASRHKSCIATIGDHAFYA